MRKRVENHKKKLVLAVLRTKLLFFKVLVVLAAFPVAAPGEAVAGEEPVDEVAFLDESSGPGLLRLVAVGGVRLAGKGCYAPCAVVDVGVVERIDVDGQAQGVL